MSNELTVIIVSFNTKELTLRCLDLITRELLDYTHDITIVDNCSHDGSAEAIRNYYPQILVIENNFNMGFGSACNLAMERASGKFLLFLNSDAFFCPGSLPILLNKMKRFSNIGMIGPAVLDENQNITRSCFRFTTLSRLILSKLALASFSYYPAQSAVDDQDVDWLSGCCMLVRSEVYRQVGGFDPQFFLYFEETDWAYRIRKSGWRVVYTPEPKVVHIGGASTRMSNKWKHGMLNRSEDLLVKKHFGNLGRFMIVSARLIGAIIKLPLLAVHNMSAKAAAKSSRLERSIWDILFTFNRIEDPRESKLSEPLK